ncbi:roadblock/LC7 domain-containing protein [Actinacidiphila sp. DG2A-62]|uniref:roadblock/LC7 domain-containing protein n=1 Tax=Actinacidiphila sp. DG2A-62 TaxID=3108821 RepID=UPI002DBC1257|nr:roadblock/LC7 domain-containing protein [Actinacidiphila sp. DG2A-62]MEC3997209.1 roadblock/LC7 domain-containing protein [Actinacidiphila sp. DG2A-62]
MTITHTQPPAAGNPQVQQLLDRRLAEVAHLQDAVIATRDGILQYASGTVDVVAQPGRDPRDLHREAGERRSAMLASLASLAERVTADGGVGRHVRSLVEARDGWCVIGPIGRHSLVLLYALKSAEPGMLGHHLARLDQDLGALLDTERRGTAQLPGPTA